MFYYINYSNYLNYLLTKSLPNNSIFASGKYRSRSALKGNSATNEAMSTTTKVKIRIFPLVESQPLLLRSLIVVLYDEKELPLTKPNDLQ